MLEREFREKYSEDCYIYEIFGIAVLAADYMEEHDMDNFVLVNVIWRFESMKQYDGCDVYTNLNGKLELVKYTKPDWEGIQKEITLRTFYAVEIPKFLDEVIDKFSQDFI